MIHLKPPPGTVWTPSPTVGWVRVESVPALAVEDRTSRLEAAAARAVVLLGGRRC